ncbi:unnamed protein product [Boreogadus saida]
MLLHRPSHTGCSSEKAQDKRADFPEGISLDSARAEVSQVTALAPDRLARRCRCLVIIIIIIIIIISIISIIIGIIIIIIIIRLIPSSPSPAAPPLGQHGGHAPLNGGKRKKTLYVAVDIPADYHQDIQRHHLQPGREVPTSTQPTGFRALKSC